MIKAVIVEDEKKSVEVLKILIERYCTDIEIIGVANNVSQGIEVIEKFEPTLVFLDIEMPDGTGFDLLQKIEDKNFDVIFTTAYIQYAIKAIQYSAMDYILKPIGSEELVEAVDRYKARTSHSVSGERLETLIDNLNPIPKLRKIVIPEGDGLSFVKLDDIIRCESDGNYTYIMLVNGKRIVATKTLGDYEDMLKEEKFFRIHRSHLINLEHIERYIKGEGGYVLMSDGSEVEVARRKKADFLQRINPS